MNRKGQLVVEYVLLLAISVSLGVVIVKGLVSRGDEPGVIVVKWHQILTVIGSDVPDKKQ